MVEVIIAFFCGLCFYTFSDAIADWLCSKAQILEATAEKMRIDNYERKKRLGLRVTDAEFVELEGNN